MVRAPRFWHEVNPGIAASLLLPAGALYGAAVALRWRFATPVRVPVPVVCIGNPGLGGGGKTPCAIAIAARLTAVGLKPHFLSRGYGGRLAGPIGVDPARHGAGDVGDEPLLLARHRPAHVARDRVAGARHAAGAGAGVIVMDDGYQNPSIAKDCAILAIDGAAGIGNGRVFPAGPLRENWEVQIARADGVIVVGDGAAGRTVAAACRAAGVEVIAARLARAAGAPDLAGREVIAFSGIALPQKFEASLNEAGARIVAALRFADHRAFTTRDVQNVLAASARHSGAIVMTTEKDMVRIGPDNDPDGALRACALTLPVEIVFDEPERIDRLLAAALR